jgi:plasmid stability protein
VKLSRRGGLRLRLEPVEVSVLTALLTQLDATLGGENAADPVVQRLYPSAYPDDDAAEADYREITEAGLRSERQQRAAACAAELSDEVDLTDREVATRWIKVLNDLRLVLGTRLGVTEDDPDFDLADPAEQPRMVYHWLTGVQDAVVHALMS